MQELEVLANSVGQTLLSQRLLLATAESCTGGLVSMLMTSFPGSSGWFERGWVTYSNSAKMAQLGVPMEVLENHGAVSEACVLAMAKGAIKQSLAHVSVAISGIAGPGGGTPAKPVGTVWLAWGQKLGYAEAGLFHFEGERQEICRQAAAAALEGLLERLGTGRKS